MARIKSQCVNKIEGCCLVWVRDGRPLDIISSTLQRSGIKIEKFDKKTNSIKGRIGSLFNSFACKVNVRLYDHGTVSLVSIVCEASRRRFRGRAISIYLKDLKSNLEKTFPIKPEDVVGYAFRNILNEATYEFDTNQTHSRKMNGDSTRVMVKDKL